MAVTAEDQVIALPRAHEIGASAAMEIIIALACDDLVVPGVADDDLGHAIGAIDAVAMVIGDQIAEGDWAWAWP